MNDTLNLCEMLPHFMRNWTSLSDIMQGSKVDRVKRVYLGSYFCSQSFINTREYIIHLAKQCRQADIWVTLAVPIFSEKNLRESDDAIDSIIHGSGNVIDEIVVNEYSQLSVLHEKYNMSLGMGRLLFKNQRDIRYPDLLNAEYENAATDFVTELIEKYNIGTIEYDPIHKSMTLAMIEGALPAVHYPYCYISTGMVCEFASVNRPLVQKFRPNCSCACECGNVFTFKKLKGEDGMHSFCKIGRTEFYNAGDINIRGDVRMIYSPFDFYVKEAEEHVYGNSSTI